MAARGPCKQSGGLRSWSSQSAVGGHVDAATNRRDGNASNDLNGMTRPSWNIMEKR